MTWRDRILADGSNRDAWKEARYPVIGASDAKILSKASSIPLYLAGKLKRDVFTGNVFTETGYRFEPMVLAWAGFDHNVALVHAPDEPGFAATPDGVKEFGNGDLALAEVKVKHVPAPHTIKGPTLPEKRQLAWQFRVFPEAYCIDWLCAEVDRDTEDLHEQEPWKIRFYPDDPELVAIQSKVEPIAVDLLGRLRAALEFEKELAS
ncbi:hypothetical protein SCB71_06455 [Herbiconiux sp. KACC 21604]|uniref:hypothetical protein n=1 Tax=unclassified Herbiconiux TaxID=2618217 RepID=UPI001490A71F|nr:hypothetical protein [Herbiconiux sp. SALV-R1]QJU52956.1 hypothetical protein HL652_04440 [Herbiconiux sp. SALV-R1]WPO87880.1 hypothetical protein SCB71_06455 [Herbiconiux sp. KACC 21604]